MLASRGRCRRSTDGWSRSAPGGSQKLVELPGPNAAGAPPRALSVRRVTADAPSGAGGRAIPRAWEAGLPANRAQVPKWKRRAAPQ